MTKIKDEPAIADNEIVDTNLLIMRDTPNQVTKKVTWLQLKSAIMAFLTSTFAAKADLVAGKVPASQIPETHFKGKYVSLVALQTAVPTGSNGDYAVVDTGPGSDAQNYIWDTNEGWVTGSVGGGVTSFASRVGVVSPQNGDYSTNMITVDSNKNFLPNPIPGWNGNTGPDLRSGFDVSMFAGNPEATLLAQYFNALITDLRAQGIIA